MSIKVLGTLIIKGATKIATMASSISGYLWLWGLNSFGQIGDDTTTNKSSPVQTIATGSNWKQISCGYGNSTAAIKTDGTLWLWGKNNYGQIGDDTTIYKSSPVQTIAAGTNWQQVSTSGNHTAAIKTDGTLWVWGINSSGQLGDNTSVAVNKSSPIQTITYSNDWKQVSCGNLHTAAIKKNGTLWCWGSNSSGQLGDNASSSKSSPVQTIAGGTNWVQVSCGIIHTAAIKSDGTLWCWGYNVNGGIGDNTTTDKSSPIQTVTHGTTWKQVSCGGLQTSAIKTDGTLWFWGDNSSGLLGDNTVINRSSPVQTVAYGTDWKQVSCGHIHSTAIKTDGTLWSWGSNAYGQLGDSTTTNRSSPVQTIADGTNWIDVSAGKFTGAIYQATSAPTVVSGYLWLWGRNQHGQIGDNSTLNNSSPVQTISGDSNWKKILSSGYFSGGIKTDGTLWTWGDNTYGGLGDNSTIDKSSPVQTIAYGSNWKDIAGGSGFVAAIKNDGTLWLWGENAFGELGDNTQIKKSSPIQTIAGGSNWKLISCGSFFSAGIKNDNSLWLWGDNSYGKLGNNTTTNKSSPVQTISYGTDWKKISCGNNHVAAIKLDGTLWCWGDNSNGQLGDNSTTEKSSPIQTIAGGNDWQQVDCGNSHTVATKTDGSFWVWGNNSYGQLGLNSVIHKSSPIQTISYGTNWKIISAGDKSTGAIKTDGTIWCWGDNTYGQLLDNTTIHKSSPIQIIASGTQWYDLYVGSDNIAAISGEIIPPSLLAGSLWSWGYNFGGILGDNTTTNRSSPVQVYGNGNQWTQISFRSGIKTDGTLWLWGFNAYGDIGDNTATNKSSPVQTISYSSNWKQVSSVTTHTAAIKTDGTLWVWGRNDYGQLGTNNTTSYSSPVQTIAGGSNWKYVQCGYKMIAAIKTDGTLWLWGKNSLGQLGDNTTTNRSSPIQTITYQNTWKEISIQNQTSQVFCAAIKTDGTLWLWGYNTIGCLGDNTTTNRSSPVQTIAGGTDWKQVSLGLNRSGAIKNDGTLWCWGQGVFGELGDNTTIDKSSPVQTIAGGTNWKYISCDSNHSGAIKNDGTLWTWGLGSLGQLGTNTNLNYSSPVQTIAGGTNWKSVHCGLYTIYGIRQ